MSSPDVDAVLRVPGFLCVNPTDLTLPWPHGGAGLGLIAETAVRPVQRYEAIRAEEWGGEVIERIRAGGSAVILTATLRQWDESTISAIFSTTGSTGHKVALFGAEDRGKIAGISLLFTPREVTAHPSMLATRAIPLIDEMMELKLALLDELVIPVVFECLRGSFSNPKMKIGKLADLSL